MDAERLGTQRSGPRCSAGARRVGRRLAFEALEGRRLLAAQYDFAVNLYADGGGVPGELIGNDTVQTGDAFFVEITAEDLRPGALGLRSLTLDIAWDPQVFQVLDDPFDPLDPASPLVTSAFPLWRRGLLDNESGEIDRLRGGALLSVDAGRPIGADGAERFCLLHFRALEPAEYSPLHVRSGTVGFIPVRRYSQADLSFESQLITVVERSAADPAVSLVTASAEEDHALAETDGVSAEAEATPPVSWQNPLSPSDVNGRDGTTPLDALIAINYINERDGDPTLPEIQAAPPPFYDVNGDHRCTANDALLILNALETQTNHSAEGEAFELPDQAAAATESDAVPPAAGTTTQVAYVKTPEVAAPGADAGLPEWRQLADPWIGMPMPFPVDGARPGDSLPGRPEHTCLRPDRASAAAAILRRQERQQRGHAVRLARAADGSPSSLAWLPLAPDLEDVLDTLAAAQTRGRDGEICVWDRA